MNKDLQELIGNSQYAILKNGKVVEGSISDLSLKSGDFKVIHYIDKDTNMKIDIQNNEKVRLIEIFYEVIGNIEINIDINCHKNASLTLLSFKKNEKSENIRINVNTYLEEDAYIESKNITSFSSSSLFNQNIYMLEKNSHIDSLDVIINASNKKQEFNFDTYHNVGDSYSNMRNFCICKNDSLIHMNTNGKIKKGSSNSNLSQKTKGLILDQTSQISANPLLLIDEYDCLASHGASIGAIDEEELYYLMSRGLTKEDSERLIVEGFIHPFIEELNDEKLQSYLLGFMKKIL